MVIKMERKVLVTEKSIHGHTLGPMEALVLGGNMTSPLGKADKTNSLLL